MAQLIKVVVKHFVSIKCSMDIRYKKSNFQTPPHNCEILWDFNWIGESCMPGHLKCTGIYVLPLRKHFCCALVNQNLGVALVPNKFGVGVVLFHFKDMEKTHHLSP